MGWYTVVRHSGHTQTVLTAPPVEDVVAGFGRFDAGIEPNGAPPAVAWPIGGMVSGWPPVAIPCPTGGIPSGCPPVAWPIGGIVSGCPPVA